MKRAIAITVIFLLLFTGCSSDIPELEECALCDAFPQTCSMPGGSEHRRTS